MLMANIWTDGFIEADPQSGTRDGSSPDWHETSIALPTGVAEAAARARCELVTSFDVLASTLFQRASEHVRGCYQDEIDRLEAEVASLRTQHQDEIRQLQAEHLSLLDDQRANLERRDQCNKKLVTLLDRQRTNLKALQADCAASRAALSEIQGELERTREALAAARSEIALSEERVRAAEEQRDQATQEAAQHVATLRAQIAAVGGALQQLSRRG